MIEFTNSNKRAHKNRLNAEKKVSSNSFVVDDSMLKTPVYHVRSQLNQDELVGYQSEPVLETTSKNTDSIVMPSQQSKSIKKSKSKM